MRIILMFLFLLGCSSDQKRKIPENIPLEHPFFHVSVDNKNYSYFNEVEIEGSVIFPRELFNNDEPALKLHKINGLAVHGNNKIFFFGKEFVNLDIFKGDHFEEGDCYKMSGCFVHSQSFAGNKRYRFRISEKPVKIGQNIPIPFVKFTGISTNINRMPALKTEVKVYRLLSIPKWPKNMIDRTIEVSGLLDRSNESLNVKEWKFQNIDEFLGKEISLNGKMWSLNGKWWFEYNKNRFYISYLFKNKEWAKIRHGYEVKVSGTLFKELRPSLEQISFKSARDLVNHYVIKNAKIECLNDLENENERFGYLFYKVPGYSDGLIELVVEWVPVKNMWPGMNSAWFLYQRNFEIIRWIISQDSPKNRKTLIKRMRDSSIDPVLRYLYAGILARLHDPSGLAYLKEEIEKKTLKMDSALSVLGNYPFFSENTMKELPKELKDLVLNLLQITAKVKIEDQINLKSVSYYSFLHLSRLIEEYKPKEIIKYCCQRLNQPMNDAEKYNLVYLLRHIKLRETQDALANHLKQTKDLKEILREGIEQSLIDFDHPDAVDLLLKNLKDNYYRLRDSKNSTIAEKVSKLLPELTGEDLEYARMLLIYKSAKPVERLLEELQKNQISKNFLLYTLCDFPDKRSLRLVAKILKETPEVLCSSSFTDHIVIEHALNVIKNEKSNEAVYRLIQLLSVTFDSKKLPWSTEDFHNLIVERLVELTEVSFGTNKSDWMKWFNKKFPKYAQ